MEALADDAGTYEADALQTILSAPRVASPTTVPPQLAVPGLPAQAEVDRLLSSYEAWVEVDIALPDDQPPRQLARATLYVEGGTR